MKKYIFIFILSLSAAVTLFSINNDALALPIIYEGTGNLKQQDVDYINFLINEEDPNLPDINPLSWPPSENVYEGTEYKEYLFEGLENVIYLITKSGNFSQLIYVGNVNSYLWTSPNGAALSNSVAAPVPEPSTIFLLGTGLFAIVGFGRKKLRKK
jgi:hypothetical protein